MSELRMVSESEQNSIRNKIIVCVEGNDWFGDYEDYDLSFDSDNEAILTRLQPLIEETFNVDIKDDSSGWLYKTRKATDSRNIYIIPNSTAG